MHEVINNRVASSTNCSITSTAPYLFWFWGAQSVHQMLKIIITYVIWEYSIYWAIKHCSEECEEGEKKWRINAATDRNDNRWLRTKRETCSINYTKIYENILLSIKRKHQINSVQRTTTVNAKRAHVCIHFCTEQRSCYQRSHFIGSRCVGFLSDKNEIHREWMNASIAHAHNYVDFVVIWNNIISTHTLSMKLSNLFAYKKAVATKMNLWLIWQKKERLWFCSLA